VRARDHDAGPGATLTQADVDDRRADARQLVPESERLLEQPLPVGLGDRAADGDVGAIGGLPVEVQAQVRERKGGTLRAVFETVLRR